MGSSGYRLRTVRIRIRIRFTYRFVYSFNYYWRMLFKQRWIRRRLLLTLSIHHATNVE